MAVQPLRRDDRDVYAELDALRRDVNRLLRQRRGATVQLEADRVAEGQLWALMGLIAREVGSQVFTARHVFDLAAAMEAATLRDALAAAGVGNPRQLGRRLRLLARVGTPTTLRLQCVSTADRDGCVWCLTPV